MTFIYNSPEYIMFIAQRRHRQYERRQYFRSLRGTMDYASTFRQLQEKALRQKHFPIANRTRDSHHYRYAVHLHGTHRWVSKAEWDALPIKHRLDLSKYEHTNKNASERYTYAIPVPGTPVYLKVYHTDVAKWNRDGTTILNAGTWQGHFTKRWLNYVRYVDLRSVRKDRWMPTTWGMTDRAGTETEFYNGLTLDLTGRIISDVQPIYKHVLDRTKAKVWHEAMKHFRDLTLPFVAMLDGTEAPAPIVEAMLHTTTTFGSAHYAKHILSHPTEIDPVLTTMLCLQSWYATPAAWAHGNQNHRCVNAMYRFENRLRVLYRDWARTNALRRADEE